MTPARPLAAAAALGFAGAFAVPALPAAAAPVACERPERYAAQSGAELFRLNKLTLRAAPAADPADTASGRAKVAAAHRAEAPGTAGPSDTAGAGTADAGSGSARPANGGGKATGAGGGKATGAGGGKAAGTSGGGKAAGTNGGASGGGSGTGVEAPDGGPVRGKAGGSIGDVRIGEAKSILAAGARPSAAAVTRMLNSADKSKLSDPLVQEAPPANADPARRDTPAAEAGPLLLDTGTLASHAQWAAGMDCGAAYGEVTRAQATLGAAQVAGVATDALVAVPESSESLSTTALEKRGPAAGTVASATVGAKTIELFEGAVTVRIVRPPTLVARMSMKDGGEVGYVPATLEVFGDGIETTKLDTAGDVMEMTFDGKQRPESGLLSKVDDLRTGPELPLPAVPGLTWPGSPEGGAAPAAGPGTHVKISLGDVRQASSGHSIAARAEAVTIAISEGGTKDRTKPGYGGDATGVVLDLDFGVLEAAAVAPEPAGGSGVEGAVSGAGGGLPITGPRVDLLALSGVALVIGGVAAMVFGTRRRRP